MQNPLIVGVDPGTRVVGFACIEVRLKHPGPKRFRIREALALKPSTDLDHHQRLHKIHSAIYSMLSKWQPSAFVIEKAFHGLNPTSSLKLGEARGAIIAACMRHEIPLFEINPTSVKKTVTGSGSATKEQVAIALQYLLNFDRGNLPFDISDALAIALSHALGYSSNTEKWGNPITRKQSWQSIIKTKGL